MVRICHERMLHVFTIIQAHASVKCSFYKVVLPVHGSTFFLYSELIACKWQHLLFATEMFACKWQHLISDGRCLYMAAPCCIWQVSVAE